MKTEIIHETIRLRERRPYQKDFSGSRCGRGENRTKNTEKVTCGRCKLLAKFAAKRAKKGKR